MINSSYRNENDDIRKHGSALWSTAVNGHVRSRLMRTYLSGSLTAAERGTESGKMGIYRRSHARPSHIRGFIKIYTGRACGRYIHSLEGSLNIQYLFLILLLNMILNPAKIVKSKRPLLRGIKPNFLPYSRRVSFQIRPNW